MNYYAASYPADGLHGTVVLHVDDDAGSIRIETNMRADESVDAATKRLVATLTAFIAHVARAATPGRA